MTKERRKFMRIATSFAADFWAKGPSMGKGQGEVFNFSREGVGMTLPTGVEPGEHIDLTFKVPGDNIPVFATTTVAWSYPTQEKSRFGVGLRFHSIKPLDLARLLDFVYSQWLGGVRKNL